MYPGKVTLLRAEHQPLTRRAQLDPSLGWTDFAEEGVDIKIIPGNHVVMLRKPYIEFLGRRLSASLNEIDG